MDGLSLGRRTDSSYRSAGNTPPWWRFGKLGGSRGSYVESDVIVGGTVDEALIIEVRENYGPRK